MYCRKRWTKSIFNFKQKYSLAKWYVSVTISGTNYKTVIQTFNSKGEELFKTYLSTTNVIDTDISDDNRYLAIAEANFSGVVIQSNIKIISIDEAKNNSAQPIKYTYMANVNDLIINIKYNKENLICMYDEHIDIFKEGENTELIKLSSENDIFADINIQNRVAKIVKTKENFLNTTIELQIINSNNINDIKKYKIDNIPKKVYTQGNMIAINLGNTVIFVDDSGWLVKKYESYKEEIQNIVMCEEIAGIISKNKINIISL